MKKSVRIKKTTFSFISISFIFVFYWINLFSNISNNYYTFDQLEDELISISDNSIEMKQHCNDEQYMYYDKKQKICN